MKMSCYPFKRFSLLVFIFLLNACATKPSMIPQLVNHYHLQESTVSSQQFDHKVFYNTAEASQYLHVYVDGDGVPWHHRFFIAHDPTPSNSLVLQLVGKDENEAVFLGRPCYYGFNKSRNCQAKLWTSSRFSESVVSSLAQALALILQHQPDKQVILFGFSGGGALVTLMAPRVPQVVAIVTVAGTLNTSMWTRHHRYSAMKGSLNPIEMHSFPRHIRQFHIMGGEDKNVINEITESYVDIHGGEIWTYPGYTHTCCWHDIWPGVLQGVHNKLELK